MQHPDHRLTLSLLQSNFSRVLKPRKNQDLMMEFLAQHGSAIIEAPTGEGKSDVEVAYLKALGELGTQPCTLIVPTKTIAQQFSIMFPHAKVAMGRHDYECVHPLYEARTPLPMADEIPCLMLDCPSRVDQKTGETQEKDAPPCPYYQAKFEASQGGLVVSTMAFHVMNNVFKHKDWEPTGALVIDEGHRIADVTRNCLSFEITDHHLLQSILLLRRIKAGEAKVVAKFLRKMKTTAKTKSDQDGVLLDASEIKELIAILSEINANELRRKIRQAVKDGLIDPVADMVTLKRLETLAYDVVRYMHSLEYSLPGEERESKGVSKRGGALNYTCAYYRQEQVEQPKNSRRRKKVQHKLVIKCYHVAPLIRKILPPATAVFSATIGNPDIFGYETGIVAAALSLPSSFPVGNTRIYLPNDTPDLSMKGRSKRDLPQTIRQIVRTCVRFAKKGLRSLVVVISNAEREKFLMMAEESELNGGKLNVISYGNGVLAKHAAEAFKEGEGDVLVGTAAHYAEGIDLPKQIAPVIFFLRPGYPNPRDPVTVFEERRFGGRRWAIWNWRVMQQALQVRGRNIRRRDDVGVTFFISQQFKRILFGALPEWLQPAYCNQFTFDQAVKDAEKLLLE